jgi:putative transposase
VNEDITKTPADVADEKLFDNWFDPIEAELRTKVRGFIEAMIEEELETALCRPRYGRRPGLPVEDAPPIAGHRHGRRTRSLTGTFGQTEIAVPRARIFGADGKTAEWKSKVVLAYQRRTRTADALIASAYLSGTNTRRVRRALAALFRGAVGKDTVSRVWRKVKGDFDAWNARSLTGEPIIRLILDGTMVRVRLDKKSTSISLLAALGVRQDGQKILLAVKNMGGESDAAWRSFLDDLVKRGLRRPELVIVDGAPGLEKALAAMWPDVLLQRCTVHKHRNLLAHDAPDRLHEELSADYKDMIYAGTRQEVEAKRKAFIRKWRLKCPAAAASLEEAGDKRRVIFGQLEQFADATNALGDDDAEFRKMTTKRIDAHRLLLDEQFARLVQHEHSLLLRAFDQYEAHSGTRHRFADRLCVDRVVLAALDIGLGVRGRDKEHVVTHRLKLARPIMRRAASFHSNAAGFDARKELMHLRPTQLALHGEVAFAGQSVNLKIILGQIDADSDKLFHGRSPSLWRSAATPWHFDAVQVRP